LSSQRLEFERLVHAAYSARSTYAHGSTPKKEIDLPKLRRVARRCLLTQLIIGDPTAAGRFPRSSRQERLDLQARVLAEVRDKAGS
jgi:hypothetical protein